MKLCLRCKREIGKTRKFLCYACCIEGELKRQKARGYAAIRKSAQGKERKRMWDTLTTHDQQEILFNRAKEILKGGI